jgi:hypothetical protein
MSHPARIAASDAATRVAEPFEAMDDEERPKRPEGKEPVTNAELPAAGEEKHE